MTALGKLARAVQTFVGDVAQGFFEITHNGFAVVGLAVVFSVLTLLARPDLRQVGESQLMTWLHARQAQALGLVPELDAIDRATAVNPRNLPKQQAAVAYWLSKKYRVAPEPLSALVAEAYEIGARNKLDPLLLLSVMAVESSFNPFAQSPVGAQGLMQVMTGIHSDKYENFGGKLAAFDPVTNLRVGARVLQECIQRAGSVQGGLKHYVGAALLPDDQGYGAKVLAEHERLQQVANGRVVPLVTPPIPLRTMAPAIAPETEPQQAAPLPAQVIS